MILAVVKKAILLVTALNLVSVEEGVAVVRAASKYLVY